MNMADYVRLTNQIKELTKRVAELERLLVQRETLRLPKRA